MNKTPPKGILLAGGYGSRLAPTTYAVSKQLLPVFDKPLVYYSLSNLILSNIFDICVVTQKKNIKPLKILFNDLIKFGLKISYKVQNKPNGIPECLKLCKNFLGKSDLVLALGDNIFFGHNFEDCLHEGIENLNNGFSSIFIHPVKNPENFGVVDFKKGKIQNIKEKPKKPKSNNAITGLYFLTNNSINRSKKLKRSKRGETEIIDLLDIYLKENKLKYINTGRGTYWTDAGTPESLNDASNFIKSIQDSQGLLVSSLEEILLYKKKISRKDLLKLISKKKSFYYKNLINIIKNENSRI